MRAQARCLIQPGGKGFREGFSEEGMSEQKDKRNVPVEEKGKGVPGRGTAYAKARQGERARKCS